eukprot:gene611-509_t
MVNRRINAFAVAVTVASVIIMNISIVTFAAAEQNAIHNLEPSENFSSEFKFFPKSFQEEVLAPQGQWCWVDGFTEEECCPIRSGDEQGHVTGNAQCWTSPWTFEGCCLNENNCDGVVFRQFQTLLPKYLDGTASAGEKNVFEKMLRRGVFVRQHAIKSCPSVAFIAGWLSTFEPILLNSEARAMIRYLTALRFGNSVSGHIGGTHHWQWNSWGMWEALSLLSKTHNYDVEPDGITGIGAYSSELKRLHLLNSVDRDQILSQIENSAQINMADIADFGASITALIDDFVTTAYTTPTVLHTLGGPFQVLPLYPNKENQTESEQIFASKPVYLNGEKQRVFSKFDLDGVLVSLFDRFLGVSEWPYYVEIGTQSGHECNSRFFRMARGKFADFDYQMMIEVCHRLSQLCPEPDE